jgi:hypothetical protein
MRSNPAPAPRLLAFSDLHVAFPGNREIIANLWPESAADWLLVAGDVAERFADIEWALRVLSGRFATVVWAPGNHELWTHPSDEVQLRGEERYAHLVRLCRSLGVLTAVAPGTCWDRLLFSAKESAPDGNHRAYLAVQRDLADGVACLTVIARLNTVITAGMITVPVPHSVERACVEYHSDGRHRRYRAGDCCFVGPWGRGPALRAASRHRPDTDGCAARA